MSATDLRHLMRDTASPKTGAAGIGVPYAAARRLALPCIVVLAAVLRLWHLGDAGFGTEYYAAAVRGMLSDPRNVLFGAFDPAGVLAVDKPPLALWVQALSASLLGYGPFALMLPQAIEGCLAVVLIWYLTRREFGDAAGLLAALFLALTPISVAVDRSNNTDSLLVLVLLLAVWALPRPGDTVRTAPWRLALAMALVGVGFNVKMLAAFGVLPAFAAVYAFTARVSWPRRLVHLAAGGAVLAIVSGSWIGMVALTPPSDRPYIDSTADNSIFDLVVNHNALQRFVPRAWIGGTAAPALAPSPVLARLAARTVPPGPARLIDPRLAHQVLWLLPLAVAGAVGLIAARAREAAWVWIGWTLAYGLVFSFAGGLFSAYYLVMLAPPLAVLSGAGAVTLARLWNGAGRQRWWVPAVLALGVAWQADVLRPDSWNSPQGELLVAALAGLALTCVASLRPIRRAAPLAAISIGVAALLIAPAAWSIGTIAYEGGRPLARLQPTPDLVGRSAAHQSGEVRKLLPFLRENRGDAAFLAATSSAMLAAPLIIATGEPVMAFGGFMGTIPVLDGAALARLADNGDLRFAIVGESRGRRARGADTDAMAWIRAHGTRLDLGTIVPGLNDARFELFDLRHIQPAAGTHDQ
jgi:4-amino-4-deoxy-L-arabinose transferase-like glycosyltransferase